MQLPAHKSTKTISIKLISVDCTQTDSLATNITAFQTAVKSTRDSLKAYRSSLVDLITALHGASTSTDDSSTNGTTAQ
jgi:hypothetical protein